MGMIMVKSVGLPTEIPTSYEYTTTGNIASMSVKHINKMYIFILVQLIKFAPLLLGALV